MTRPFALLLLLAPLAPAQTFTWTGAANSLWDTTSANWSGAGSTWSNLGGASAVFPGAGTDVTIGLNAVNLQDLQFGGSRGLVDGGNRRNLEFADGSLIQVAAGSTATFATTGSVGLAGGTVTLGGGGTLVYDPAFVSGAPAPRLGDGLGGTLAVAANTTLATPATNPLVNGATNPFGAVGLSLGAGAVWQVGRPTAGGFGVGATVRGLDSAAGSRIDIRAMDTTATSLTVLDEVGGDRVMNAAIGYPGGSTPAGQVGRFTLAYRNGSGLPTTYTLGGTSGYSGSTTVGSEVTVKLTNGAALGANDGNGTVRVEGGATLDLNGRSLVSNPVRLSSDGGADSRLVNTSATPAAVVGEVRPNGGQIGGTGAITLSGKVGRADPFLPDTGPLIKIGTGTVTLTNPANDYNGGTQIDAGTLTLGNPGVLPGVGTVLLNGGALQTGNGAGNTNAGGPLQVTGSGSTLLLGGGSHTLTFDELDPTGFTSLTITGWSGSPNQSGLAGRVIVTDPSAFTPGLLANVTFTGFDPGAAVLPSGELVPVPEPGLALLAAAGLLAIRRKMRATSHFACTV